MGVDVRTEGRIGWIQLNRPEKLNALNAQMFADFRQALDDLEADQTVRCIIVHGAGRAFCVGFDVDSQRSTDEDARLSAYDDWVGLRKNLDPLAGGVAVHETGHRRRARLLHGPGHPVGGLL
ncbi:enoyl-CoA hydratase/isomerase family protein [Pseudonocardia acaciae]|uniref:enoyl-CoA hydratase/isomerase family protein n=1 Tax=Pseudonocardia acaciae TaxID=551276 RepID=UPI000AE7791C|nr:enoyl-CoA hydratase/isomerase family protein [Pseudonocardia acaciae]